MQEYMLQNEIQLHVGCFCGDRHHMTSEEKLLHHLVYTEKNEFSGYAKESVKGNPHRNTRWILIGNDNFSMALNRELRHMHRSL